ncbi:PcfJ domain-containing protein [uncultured Kordia sp.]|uniref:PcfJ domain-containing protein n=1 Tax=uncultured Kordia sp. TaxID=507699 RepID=UPI0026169D3F|nr:PcfJ domain-containing protein [uncultured Kordia sp.]
METLFDLDIHTKQVYIPKKKRKQSDFINIINCLYQDATNVLLEMDGKLTSLYAYYFSRLSTHKNIERRQTFKRLLIHLYKQRCFQIIRDKKSVDILFKISLNGDRFVRNPEGWKREGLNEFQQMESLLKHCFELYPTADFLRETFKTINYTHITWYLDIALGKSVFDLAGFPKMMTKKMAHEFTKVDEKCSIEKALSIAIIKSYKPSEMVARLLLNSSLVSQDLTQDKFWRSAIEFFCKYELLEQYEFYGVLDYLQHIKNEDAEFCLKGRSLNGLKRLSDEWHSVVYLQKVKKRKLAWKAQEMEPFEYTDTNEEKEKKYKIKELCTSVELYIEGMNMGHCVASYDSYCLSGNSSIFSLYEFAEEDKLIERLVTLEISPKDKKIVQARGKFNQKPSKIALTIIKKWAKEMEYAINEYAY